MKVLAIDPGDVRSAWVVYEMGRRKPHVFRAKPGIIRGFGIDENAAFVRGLPAMLRSWLVDDVAMEQVRSYGMTVGREVFETCEWTGRIVQAIGGEVSKVPRKDVKIELLGKANGNDTQIRHALWAYFGGGRREAVGTKANPGPMFGMTGNDLVAALAVAVTYASRIARHQPFEVWGDASPVKAAI